MSATVATEIPRTDPKSRYLPQNRAKLSRSKPAEAHWWSTLSPALLDALFVCSSGLLAYLIRFSPALTEFLARLDHLSVHPTNSGSYLGCLLVYASLLLLSAHSLDLYRTAYGRPPLTESLLVIRAVAVATLVLAAFIYLSGNKSTSRLVVGFTATFSVITLVSWRMGRAYVVRKNRAKGLGLRHVLIVGAGRVGRLLADQFERAPILGYKVAGFLDANHNGDSCVLGKIEDLARVARQEFIDEVFITIPSQRELVKKISLEARHLNLDVKVVSELYDGLAWLSPLEFVGDFPVRILHREPIPAFGLFVKRMIDITGAAAALVLLSPLLLLIAIAIRMSSPGPCIYKSVRVGKKGRRFVCIKFRTMVPDADQRKEELRQLNQRQGPFFKINADPRVTGVGRFLRKYSLDELPQLWNVLKGDMSLVGPRPPAVEETTEYQLEQLRRLDVTPGITGLWQVSARHEPSFDMAVAFDNQYIENWNLMLDVRILLKTFFVVLKGTGC